MRGVAKIEKRMAIPRRNVKRARHHGLGLQRLERRHRLLLRGRRAQIRTQPSGSHQQDRSRLDRAGLRRKRVLQILERVFRAGQRIDRAAFVLRVLAHVDQNAASDEAIGPLVDAELAVGSVLDLIVGHAVVERAMAHVADVAEAVRKATAALAEAGVKVEEALPPGVGDTFEIYRALFCADGGAGLKSLIELAGTREIHPLLQQALEIQQQHGISMAEYGALVGRWDAFRSAMLVFMESYDAILSPVCSFAGMVHGSTYKRLPCFSYTMVHNLTGWPAAVVRTTNSSTGLPVGVQIAAGPWHEHVALAIARRLEEALGGWQAPPL